MYSEITWVDVTMCCLGLAGVVMGILVRLGIDKTWFRMQRVATVVIPSFGFGLIPVGLAICATFLIPFWTPSIGTRSILLFCGAMPLLFFGFLLVFWQPRWALPKWFWWLKENYDDIMVELRQDARRLGKAWEDRVRTQEGLEQWAEEVRQRVEAERRSKRPSYRNKAS